MRLNAPTNFLHKLTYISTPPKYIYTKYTTTILDRNFILEACKPPPRNFLMSHNFSRTGINLYNTIRTASRTQEHLQGNLHQLHQNATKQTNEISPKANPSVDRALLYFLQQI
jgi:hypothetical protein